MKSYTIFHRLLGAPFFTLAIALSFSAPRARAAEPSRIFILYSGALAVIKRGLAGGDPTLTAALRALKRDADRAVSAKLLSVTDKELVPPSGDKHDYMSIAPYWWPNPHTQNGLPYLRRDGEVNPERDQSSDRKRLGNLVQSVKVLALAYFYMGRDDYAAHGAQLLRAWFIDDATRMNPHLRYAQAVPGRNQGRGAGIIETHNLPELVDAIGLLSGWSKWNQAEQKILQEWFGKYLIWLLESAEGKAEAKARNNHGTWYDVQVASLALFAGRDEAAQQILSEFPAKRIAKQIEPDGRQPHELERTQSWNYSIFNLEAMFNAAAIGEKVGLDLWQYEAPDKRSIRKALDWLVPFASGEKKWPYQQLSALQPEKLAPLLRHAALRYRDPIYAKAIFKLPKLTGEERWQLLRPKTPEPK